MITNLAISGKNKLYTLKDLVKELDCYGIKEETVIHWTRRKKLHRRLQYTVVNGVKMFNLADIESFVGRKTQNGCVMPNNTGYLQSYIKRSGRRSNKGIRQCN